MALPDWAEWHYMIDDSWQQVAVDKARILADWLEENGLDALGGCLRHWADAEPRVRLRYWHDYQARMIYLCHELERVARPNEWMDVPGLWVFMGERWATFNKMVRLTPRPPKRREDAN